MKIKTNKTGIMIILSMLFALCVGLGIAFSNTTVTASASTTPKYTLTVSGTTGSGTWGGGVTNEVTDVTSVSIRNSLSATDTISFYLSGSTVSGSATLANNSYITFSDVKFSSSASDCVITIYNDTEQVVKTGTSSISTTLANGRYKIKFDVNRSGGSGYTKWSGAANVYTYVTLDTTKPSISGASTSTSYYKTSAFTVMASDSTSGLENLYVKTPTSGSFSAVGSSKSVSASDPNGLYCFYAIDKAGNKSSTYYVYFDNTKPAGAIKTSGGTTLTGTYTNTAFNYTVNDSESGINYSVYTCTRCGDTYNDDVVSANGHDYGSWYTVKDSTCLDTGIKRRDCVSCGNYETGVIEAKGHNYVSAVTSPTCTEQGYTTHVCSRCTDTYVDSYVDAHGHNYVATVTAATCTERGYTTQTCSDCGDSYIENYTDAHGHTYGAWKISKNATCTESGLRYKTCTVCGYKYNEAIPALGHDYRAEEIEPTCVDKGYTTHICSRCGVGYNDTFVDALGHDYQAIKVESTCVEEGYIGQRCSRCGDTYKTEILKATGHTYVEEYVEATCTEEGCIRHICLTCGFEYKTDVVNPSGHSLETHVLIAATCEERGERYYGCTRCDYERIDEIPAKGHKYELAQEDNVDGVIKRTYICTTCTDSYVQDMGAEYQEVSNYVEYLFDEYSPYMIWVFLATAGVWSLAMGIAIIIATKNEDKVKARKMLINYVIGLVVIFVILVAAPLLVKGIAALVT